MNIKKICHLLILCLSLILVACGPTASELEFTSLNDLNSNPVAYDKTTVKVQGRVVEFLGEDSHFILLPYITTRPCMMGKTSTICTDIKLSLSQVRVAEFRLRSGDDTIVVSERTGGLYLPIPIVPAGTPSLPEGEIIVVGYWSTKADGTYVLYVSGSEEVDSSASSQQ